MTKYTSDRSNFGADGPFFRIIREGLEGLADGEDYFDLLADDVVQEGSHEQAPVLGAGLTESNPHATRGKVRAL